MHEQLLLQIKKEILNPLPVQFLFIENASNKVADDLLRSLSDDRAPKIIGITGPPAPAKAL